MRVDQSCSPTTACSLPREFIPRDTNKQIPAGDHEWLRRINNTHGWYELRRKLPMRIHMYGYCFKIIHSLQKDFAYYYLNPRIQILIPVCHLGVHVWGNIPAGTLISLPPSLNDWLSNDPSRWWFKMRGAADQSAGRRGFAPLDGCPTFGEWQSESIPLPLGDYIKILGADIRYDICILFIIQV